MWVPKTSGLVSKLYNILLSSSCGPLPVHLVWERDLDHHDGDVDWFTVWDNLDCTSKNPNHELINFNFIHRLYFTPRKRHLMKLTYSPICHLCTLGGLIHAYVLGVS